MKPDEIRAHASACVGSRDGLPEGAVCIVSLQGRIGFFSEGGKHLFAAPPASPVKIEEMCAEGLRVMRAHRTPLGAVA